MSRVGWLTVVACAVVAAVITWVATGGRGPGIEPDSLSYVGAAVSLAGGGGVRVPMSEWDDGDSTSALSHFPPGVSIALSVPASLGVPPLQGVRVLNALCAAVSSAALVAMAWSAGGAVTVAVAIAFALMPPPYVDAHLAALSEPLFLASAALLLLLLVVAPSRAWLIGLAAAVGAISRYAAISLAGTAALAMLSMPWTRRERLGNALRTGIPTVVLLGAWLARLHFLPGDHSIRDIGLYGQWRATWAQGWETVVTWLAPELEENPARIWVAAIRLVAAAVVVVWASRLRGNGGEEEGARRRGKRVLTLFAVCYAAVVLASRLLADPGIPFDERILVPVLLAAALRVAIDVGAIAGAGVIARAGKGATGVSAIADGGEGKESRQGRPTSARRSSGGRRRREQLAGIALALVGVSWTVASVAATHESVQAAREEGVDFAQQRWSESPLVQWVRVTGRGRTLYTNWPPVLWFHAGRPSHLLPAETSDSTRSALARVMAADDGVVVGFNELNEDTAPPDSIAAALRLTLIARFPEGAVWGLLSAKH